MTHDQTPISLWEVLLLVFAIWLVRDYINGGDDK